MGFDIRRKEQQHRCPGSGFVGADCRWQSARLSRRDTSLRVPLRQQGLRRGGGAGKPPTAVRGIRQTRKRLPAGRAADGAAASQFPLVTRPLLKNSPLFPRIKDPPDGGSFFLQVTSGIRHGARNSNLVASSPLSRYHAKKILTNSSWYSI